MPLPWYITVINKFFISPWAFLMPLVLVMEAYRGAFLSASSMGIFVEEGVAPPMSTKGNLLNMRIFLDEMKGILETIPTGLRPILGPWFDYYNASECFYQILQGKLSSLDMPTSCQECWTSQQDQQSQQ